MGKLSEAREYIKENKNKVNPEYRLGYHAMGEIGWINDPNGFCFYKGEYHLFYQYHPYSSKWGPMHWGHIKSKDLISWEYMPVSLAPDMSYDIDGCFSGSAIEKDGKLYLMYTGLLNPNPDIPENVRQIQNIAVSEDGIEFKKVKENPVIDTKDIPGHGLPQDFRDPKVFKHGDEYYAVISSRNIDGSGEILVYKSKELLNWTYAGVMASSKNKYGKMWECPDLFKLGNCDILLVSPQFLDDDGDRYHNVHSSIFMLGQFDFESSKYNFNFVDEIDYGFDFYAPQTLIDDKGRRILVAWMQMWDRKIPTNEKNHNWAGAMTLPRELKIIDGKLYQYPVDETKNYRINHVSYKDIKLKDILTLDKIEGQKIELELEVEFLEANTFGLNVLKDEDQQTTMYYDKKEGKFNFDRSKNGEDLSGAEADNSGKRRVSVALNCNKLKLHIFIDRISVEIFIQDGERVMTSTVYPKSSAKKIEFFSEGEVVIKSLDKWDIKSNISGIL
jgi:beta-fructofuranosidase